MPSLRTNSAHVWPDLKLVLAEFGQTESCPNLGPMLPNSGQLGPNFGHIWPNLVDVGQTIAKLRPALSRSHQLRPRSGLVRSIICQRWPKLVKLRAVSVKLGPTWAEVWKSLGRLVVSTLAAWELWAARERNVIDTSVALASFLFLCHSDRHSGPARTEHSHSMCVVFDSSTDLATPRS